MAWIESHQELRLHPKTRKLARELGISLPQAIGHLHCLWWWALDYAQDGDLSQYEADEIADGAEWQGEPIAFLEALELCGFVTDKAIHDWQDYAGRLIEKRAADAARKRAARRKDKQPQSTDVHRTSAGHPRDGARTVPNLTVPNHQGGVGGNDEYFLEMIPEELKRIKFQFYYSSINTAQN